MDHQAPQIAESNLGRSERLDRSTLPPRITLEFAPWRILVGSDLGGTAGLTIRLAAIDFYRVGVIQLLYQVTLKPESRCTVTQLMPKLSAAREAIEVNAESFLADMANGTASAGRGTEPSELALVDRCLVYELVDFGISKGDQPIACREVLAGSEHARELAGFLRMSRPGAWEHYNAESVLAIAAQTFGNRDDDLFFVGERRLYRCHPEERVDVALWFDDLRLAAGIMLATETFLEFASRMLADTSALLPAEEANPAPDGLEKLVLSESLLSRLADPFLFERAVGHSFFREVLTRMREGLGLPQLHGLVLARVEQVRTGIDYVIQLRLAAIGAKSAKRTERLTTLVVVLTLVMLVVGAGQIATTLITAAK